MKREFEVRDDLKDYVSDLSDEQINSAIWWRKSDEQDEKELELRKDEFLKYEEDQVHTYFQEDGSITEVDYWKLVSYLAWNLAEFDREVFIQDRGLFVGFYGIHMNLNDMFYFACGDSEEIPRDILYKFFFEWNDVERISWIEGVRGMKIQTRKNIRCICCPGGLHD